jgi:hypothetical protein
MSEDGVAPVIAVMLVLAAVTTVLVLFNGIYIPSLKQAADAEHLRNVEAAFQQFSSDIEGAAASPADTATTSEPVQLGGGDVFLNTLRSGGSLSVVQEDHPAFRIGLYDDAWDPISEVNGTLVNITYEPVENFWVDQGYRWQYGYLNVTKYGTREAPLGYPGMADVTAAFGNSGTLAAFAASFAGTGYTANQTLIPDTDAGGAVVSYSPGPGNCSEIVLQTLNFTVSGNHAFASGNGFGKLVLKKSRTSTLPFPVANITIVSDGTPFGNATFASWNASLAVASDACWQNLMFDSTSNDRVSLYRVGQDKSPVNVSIKTTILEIGVQ